MDQPLAISDSAAEGEKLPAYTNHDGFLLPVGFPTSSFDSALTYEAQDNGELRISSKQKELSVPLISLVHLHFL